MKEIGRRPNVYVKLSEVVRAVNGTVSTDLSTYKDWLDRVWDVFGEDRVLFGSDWPQSESVEYNSYPSVIGVARAYVKTQALRNGESVLEELFEAVPLCSARAGAEETLKFSRDTAAIGHLSMGNTQKHGRPTSTGRYQRC